MFEGLVGGGVFIYHYGRPWESTAWHITEEMCELDWMGDWYHSRRELS